MKEDLSALKQGQPTSFLLSIVTPLVAILLLFPSPGATVECFTCNSIVNSSCKTADYTTYKVSCGAQYQGCRKWSYTFDLKGDGNTQERIVRECALTVEKDHCDKGYGASGKRFKRTICDCKKNLCNAAATIKLDLIAIGCVMLSLMILL